MRRNISSGTPWTLDQILFLRSHYGKMSAKQLSERLGHPVDSVYKKAKSMGYMQKRGGRR